MANESSDSEDHTLQFLLDAFPSAQLELIASAFTQANSDPFFAAEIIAFSLNGISSEPPPPPKLCLADQRSPPPCSKVPVFDDAHGIKDGASSGGSERHERLNLGVLHAGDDEQSHAHVREVPSVHSQKISSGELHLPGRKAAAAYDDGCKGSVSIAKQLHDSIKLSQRRPLLRPKGPCPPTLEEFFPSSPEQNAWIQPLSERLLKNVSFQSQQNTSPEHESQKCYCPGEFPSLEKITTNEKVERVCSSGLPQPLRPSKRSSNRNSAAFGLASSVRTRSRDDPLNAASPAVVKGSTNSFKQQEMKDEEKSLWPTEAEASLLSMLGEDFSLGIEAVRDVLGHYKGDIEKAFEVLSQLSFLSSNDISLNLSQHDKEFAAVTESDQNRGISCTSKGELSARQAKASEAYYTFEEAILKQENSSMKWVVESLCNKYPHADMATLLEVLRATNFDFNDAEKMLQDSGLHEGFLTFEEERPSHLAKVILESLFSMQQEVSAEIQKNHQHNSGRPKERKSANLPEIPKWEVVTSTALDVSGDMEGRGQMEEHDVMGERTLAKFSDMAVSRSEMEMSSYGAWDDYERHHASAKEHWKTMESYLKAANAAYANSDVSKAELLTEKGNMYKQLSMEAKERANIFLLEMNWQNESDFTLDLQNQHVPEALQLLRLHLKSLSPIPSCCSFTVITGCSKDTKSGRIKIKHEVVRYLKKKGYEWVETSPFCLRVQLKKANRVKVQDAD